MKERANNQNSTLCIKQYLSNIGPQSFLDTKTEKDLVEKWKSTDKKIRDYAINKLVLGCQYIVIENTLNFIDSGIETADLIQICNLELLKALEKYRDKGYTRNLKNFLNKNIFYGAQRTIGENLTLYKFSASKFRDIASYYDKLAWSNMALSYFSGMIKCLIKPIRAIHKDEPNVDDTKFPFYRVDIPNLDLFSDEDQIQPDNELMVESLNSVIASALNTLKGKESKIIRWNFGIDRDYSLTLAEIGDDLGLTRERIRQILVKALNKLKSPKKIREFRIASESDPKRTSSFRNRVASAYYTIDPFLWIENRNIKEIKSLLEEYVEPRRRKSKYPHIKNMAKACRNIIIKTLEKYNYPSSYLELENAVYKVFPELANGSFDYALSTAPGVIRSSRGEYALESWAEDAKEGDMLILGKRYKEIPIEYNI